MSPGEGNIDPFVAIQYAAKEREKSVLEVLLGPAIGEAPSASFVPPDPRSMTRSSSKAERKHIEELVTKADARLRELQTVSQLQARSLPPRP